MKKLLFALMTTITLSSVSFAQEQTPVKDSTLLAQERLELQAAELKKAEELEKARKKEERELKAAEKERKNAKKN